jgi:branched-chain amino acid transport system substrate-binding protein
MILVRSLALAFTLSACAAAHADVTIGVDLSLTGAAAAIGIQSQNAVRLWPATLGGQPAHYIVQDDASDVSRAVQNARKLTSESRVDAIVGPNTTAAALALLDTLAETGTPMLALAASGAIVAPQADPKRHWAFKMPQNDSLMADALARHMKAHGIKTIAFIGFADSYGDSWWEAFHQAAAGQIEVVANERFQRTDASVLGQVLKAMAAKPDAILIAGAGTPAALPQKTLAERGYRGPVYQTHGIATPEFLQVGGTDVEGTLFPTGPAVLARQLPEGNPARAAAVAFADSYEARYGAGTLTQFGGDAYGAWRLLDDAVSRALKTGAQPGTPAFRLALKEALENTRDLAVPNGVLTITPQDHQGFDARARVMATVKGGKFSYLGE